MILLVDLDSLLYTSVYKIVSIREMREAITKFGKESAKQWLKEEVYNEGINRCENQLLQIQNQISSMMINDVSGIELFITTCTNSFRKEISKDYKINRRRNEYVWMLRAHYQMNGALFSDTLEADDLISMRAKELGMDNCVIVSIDKDLKQIGGYYWSYYKQKSKDHFGEPILNEFGNPVTEYKQKSIDYITKEEAEYIFWEQMLMGDFGDCVSGIKPISPIQKKEILKTFNKKVFCRIGEANAKKILLNSKNLFISVAREYIIRNQKEDFKINYQLLKLK